MLMHVHVEGESFSSNNSLSAMRTECLDEKHDWDYCTISGIINFSAVHETICTASTLGLTASEKADSSELLKD